MNIHLHCLMFSLVPVMLKKKIEMVAKMELSVCPLWIFCLGFISNIETNGLGMLNTGSESWNVATHRR